MSFSTQEPGDGFPALPATPVAPKAPEAAGGTSQAQADAEVPGPAGNLGQIVVSASVLVLWAFSVVMEVVQKGEPSEATRQLLMTAVTLVLGFWLGSSSQGRQVVAGIGAQARSLFR